jgi:hypothetical protein
MSHRVQGLLAILTTVLAGTVIVGINLAERADRSVARCVSDDGSGARPCVWIADDATVGNGLGTSFLVDRNGNIHLIEP